MLPVRIRSENGTHYVYFRDPATGKERMIGRYFRANPGTSNIRWAVKGWNGKRLPNAFTAAEARRSIAFDHPAFIRALNTNA